MKKVLMSGNEAVVEGAIRAGLDCYFGYPITPQNEIIAAMSRRMVELGRVFVQSESELAAISMVYGAAVTGKRAMTTSSSPGVSLMQEGISYISGGKLPAVIVNIQRGGPGLGNIGAAQGDYFQATRSGGNGDYRTVVLAPSSVQEMMDLTFEAFDIADEYRVAVMILGDGRLGQMMEPVELRDPPRRKLPEKPWALSGAKGREPNIVRSFFLPIRELSDRNDELQAVYRKIVAREVRFEGYRLGGAELVFAAYGTCARLCREAVDILRAEGKKVGLLRPVVLWPFPEKKFAAVSRTAKVFLVVEMSAGQMIEDVRLAVAERTPVEFLGRMGGVVPTAKEICAAARKALGRHAGRKRPRRGRR